MATDASRLIVARRGQPIDILESATARNNEQVFDVGIEDVAFQIFVVDQRVAVGRIAAESGGGIALRIHVQQQRSLAGQGEGSREIDGGGRFAHASLLIHHAEDPSHNVDFRTSRAFSHLKSESRDTVQPDQQGHYGKSGW